jgi:multimeric flavodoxin WrbA
MKNDMKTAIVLGSSRSNGNTAQLAKYIVEYLNGQVIDLSNHHILPFDYKFNNKDDFDKLIEYLLSFERIVLATPMYWYSASAQMKTFLDRLSDLLNNKNGKGKQLRKKYAFLLATGGVKHPPSCFEEMFKLTFSYLGMSYQGMIYCGCEGDFKLPEHQKKIDQFINAI